MTATSSMLPVRCLCVLLLVVATLQVEAQDGVAAPPGDTPPLGIVTQKLLSEPPAPSLPSKSPAPPSESPASESPPSESPASPIESPAPPSESPPNESPAPPSESPAPPSESPPSESPPSESPASPSESPAPASESPPNESPAPPSESPPSESPPSASPGPTDSGSRSTLPTGSTEWRSRIPPNSETPSNSSITPVDTPPSVSTTPPRDQSGGSSGTLSPTPPPRSSGSQDTESTTHAGSSTRSESTTRAVSSTRSESTTRSGSSTRSESTTRSGSSGSTRSGDNTQASSRTMRRTKYQPTLRYTGSYRTTPPPYLTSPRTTRFTFFTWQSPGSSTAPRDPPTVPTRRRTTRLSTVRNTVTPPPITGDVSGTRTPPVSGTRTPSVSGTPAPTQGSTQSSRRFTFRTTTRGTPAPSTRSPPATSAPTSAVPTRPASSSSTTGTPNIQPVGAGSKKSDPLLALWIFLGLFLGIALVVFVVMVVDFLIKRRRLQAKASGQSNFKLQEVWPPAKAYVDTKTPQYGYGSSLHNGNLNTVFENDADGVLPSADKDDATITPDISYVGHEQQNVAVSYMTYNDHPSVEQTTPERRPSGGNTSGENVPGIVIDPLAPRVTSHPVPEPAIADPDCVESSGTGFDSIEYLDPPAVYCDPHPESLDQKESEKLVVEIDSDTLSNGLVSEDSDLTFL